MTLVYDGALSDFDIEVYSWMVRSLEEDGEPMLQATIANKMRCARATVRTALVYLDKRGHLTFTRYRPQATKLTDPDRVLTNDPQYEPEAAAPAREPRQPPKPRSPWG